MFFAIISLHCFLPNIWERPISFATKKGRELPHDAVNPRPPVCPVSQYLIDIR
jgi:hypothetical protein